jgi:hypothetical protein
MLDSIKELFKEGLGYTHLSGLLQQIANITNIVHVQYMKDGKAKNDAIDHICSLLQSHKEKETEEPAPSSVLAIHEVQDASA